MVQSPEMSEQTPDAIFPNDDFGEVRIDHSDPRRGKELLTITVEIGNGQRENILIYENDTAESVAEDFCKKYVNISKELKEVFTQQIDENIRQVKSEMGFND